MFYAFNWFSKPQLLNTVRSEVLEWFKTDERAFFLNKGTNLEAKLLDKEGLATVKGFIDQAWENDTTNFGGYVAGVKLNNIKGWCHFTLNPSERKATLSGLALDKDLLTTPVLQSPVLYLALVELLSENTDLEKVYLPFTEISEADRATLAMFDLLPTDTTGWWRRRHKKDKEQDAESHSASEIAAYWINRKNQQTNSRWYELSIRVDGGLTPTVNKVFSRYGYKDRIIGEYTGKSDAKGGVVVDRSGPATIRTYIPNDQNATATIEAVQTFFEDLARVYPTDPFEVGEIGAGEYAAMWEDAQVFRAGRRFVIAMGQTDYEPLPNDILIKLLPATLVFSPQQNGLHPTTSLCLELMEDYLSSATHQKVLDLGTGTAVLAIAAAQLGIDQTLALDAYDKAVEASRANVDHNNLSEKVKVEAGSLAVVKPEGESLFYTYSEEAQKPPAIMAELLPFDAIICNTYSHVLTGLASHFAASLRPGGILITSGISSDKASEVGTTLKAVGFRQLELRSKFDWVAFVHTLG